MIRKLMASSAMLALATTGAISIAAAQTEPAEQPAAIEQPPASDAATSAAAPTAGAGESDATLTPEEPTIATAFIGQSVFSSQDPESDNIGEVNDLIIGADGNITHAVIGVGGFLGIGEKDVAVPFDELEVVEQEGEIRLIYAATREDLEAAEEFDRTAYDPEARAADEQQAAQDAIAPDAGTGIAAAPAPAADAGAPSADMTAPADTAAAPTATEEPAASGEQMTAQSDTGAAAPADDQTMAAGAPAGDMAAPPAEEFAEKVAISNQFEIQSSEFALEQAESQEVRDFAQRMIDDHTKAGEDFQAALSEAGLDFTPPSELDQAHQDKLDQLQSASGADFDQQYVDMQVQAHDEAVQLFSAYSEGGDNEALKQFASNTLPTLEEHHQMIQGIADSVNVAAADATSAEQPAAEGTDHQMAADATAEQPAATEEQTAAATAAGEVGMPEGGGFVSFSDDQLRASEVIGQSIYGPDDEAIGEVADLVLQEEGDTRAALVDVGGFLGVGEKEVAIPFSDLQFMQDENGEERVTIALSREELEGLPAYEGADQDIAATGAADTGAAGTEEQAAAGAPATDDQLATDAEGAAMTGDISAEDLTADELIGATVFGSNDENLGEVDDIVLDQNGDMQAIIVDVGGFLGIGEKPVALSFDSLNVQADESGEVNLVVNATQEQLENAPAYEEEQTVQ